MRKKGARECLSLAENFRDGQSLGLEMPRGDGRRGNLIFQSPKYACSSRARSRTGPADQKEVGSLECEVQGCHALYKNTHGGSAGYTRANHNLCLSSHPNGLKVEGCSGPGRPEAAFPSLPP